MLAGFGGSNSAIIMERAPVRAACLQNGLNGVNGTNGMNGTENTVNGQSNSHTNGQSNGHTNGHTVADKTSQQRLFVFSAKSEQSLTAYLPSFSEYLDEEEVPDDQAFLQDLSYTLGQRRTQHPYRAFAVADSVEGLQEKLSSAKPARIRDRTVAFVFTGQGAQ